MMNNHYPIAALAVVALLVIAATTAGCATNTNTAPSPTPIAATKTTAGNNTTFSSGAGFNITYPKNLIIDSTTNASTPTKVVIYLSPNTTGDPLTKVDGVNVVTQELSSGQKLSDFVTYNLNQLNSSSSSSGIYKNFTILNETNLTFAGTQAHKIVFSTLAPQTINETFTTNKTIKTTQIWLINNNTGYVVAYKALLNDYDKYLAQATQIMNSFVLT
jgi:hypothetical protein